MRLVAVQKLPPAVSSCWAKWSAQVLLAALQSQVCPWSGQSKVMPQRSGWSGERKTKAKLEISWTYFRYFLVFYSIPFYSRTSEHFRISERQVSAITYTHRRWISVSPSVVTASSAQQRHQKVSSAGHANGTGQHARRLWGCCWHLYLDR